MKKYFIWAVPGAGKTHCAQKYRNVADYNTTDGLSVIPEVMLHTNQKNIWLSPFVGSAAESLCDRNEWLKKSLRDKEIKKRGVEYEWLLAVPSKNSLDEYRERYIKRNCLENGGSLYTRLLESIYYVEKYETKLRKFGCNIVSLKQNQYLEGLLLENNIELVNK